MIIRIRALVVPALLIAGLCVAADSHAQTPAEVREIVHLKGNVYRVRVGDQQTVFVTTPKGIVLVDPLSAETAKWLATEFQRRYTVGDVVYVIYTNHNFDRAEGASLFIGTATLVAHRDFNSQLSIARRADSNGVVVSERARARDRNGDGRVTSQELFGRIHDAQSLFSDERVIVIGSSTIDLAHAGTPLAPENVIIGFREERMAFASDAPPLEDVPFSFGRWKPGDVQRWLSAAASLEFDTLLLADGREIAKARITLLSSYVNALIERVSSEYEAGKSAGSFTEAKLPPAYRSNGMFQNWRGNVADIYDGLSIFRVDATVGGLAHYPVRNPVYCQSFTSCSTGGVVGAATGSLSAGADRWAAVGEFMVTDDSFTSHTSRFVDEEFALVETRASIMARYGRAGGGLRVGLLGGMAYTIGDRLGMNRVKEGLAPFAGRHPIKARDGRWGYTGGLDLVIGRRVGIVLPLRFTYAVNEDRSGTFPHRMDAQAGVALTIRLYRTIGY